MDRDRLRTPSIQLLPDCSPTPNTSTNDNNLPSSSTYYRPSSARSNYSTTTTSSSNRHPIDNLAQHMASLRMVSSSSNHSTYSTYSTTPSIASSISTPDLDTSFITTSRGGHSYLNYNNPNDSPTRRHHVPFHHDPEQESYSKRDRIRESSVGIRSCHPPTNKCILPVCPECGAFVKDRVRDFKDGVWYWYWCCGGVGSNNRTNGSKAEGAEGNREGCGKVFWFPGKAEVKKV